MGRIKLTCHFLSPLAEPAPVPATVREARKRMAHTRVAKAANLMHFVLDIRSPALPAHLESLVVQPEQQLMPVLKQGELATIPI